MTHMNASQAYPNDREDVPENEDALNSVGTSEDAIRGVSGTAAHTRESLRDLLAAEPHRE